jgi:putative tricarboxylic transport membrane protein
VGNIILLALNLPLIGIWVRLLKVPYAYLSTAILLFCLIGVYTINSMVSDIGVMLFFGVLGFLMKKFDYDPAPLVLAYILGPVFEDNIRRSLRLSGGDFSVFVTRPIALVFILLCLTFLLLPIFSWIKRGLVKKP